MDRIEALVRKLRAVIGDGGNGFYVAGSGSVWAPKARAHEIPMVIAEHHMMDAKRELQNALVIGRR